MTASDYPVTFGYGAVDGYYYGPNGIIGPFHRANDRAMDIGVKVIIGTTLIGLSGNSGLSGGAHLHTQAGSDKACQLTFNPTRLEFKGGIVVNAGVGSQWGKFVTIQVGSEFITYAHLSEIGVQIGQVIKEIIVGKITTAEVGKAFQLDGRTSTVAGRLFHATNGTVDSVLSGLIRDSGTQGNLKKINDLKAVVAKHTATIKTLTTENTTLKARVAELEAGGGGEYIPAGELYIKRG